MHDVLVSTLAPQVHWSVSVSHPYCTTVLEAYETGQDPHSTGSLAPSSTFPNRMSSGLQLSALLQDRASLSSIDIERSYTYPN